jgi:hypothetical protein
MGKWLGTAILIVALAACSFTVSETPAGTGTTPSATTDSAAVPTTVPGDEQTSAPSTAEARTLTGRLIFADDLSGIQQYDLATRTLSTLFLPPSRAVTRTLSVSPDGTQIVVAYAPPPPEDNALQFGFTDLYVMPTDGSSTLVPLLTGDSDQEVFFLPSWSPDGAYLYYSHIVPDPENEGASRHQMERMAYPDGEPEVLMIGGFSPRLSADGSKMVYVRFDPNRLHDELMIANPDGSDPKSLLSNNLFSAIDAPQFTPDGEFVLFSAVTSDASLNGYAPPPPFNVLAWLTGAQVVKAHTVPSDIWRVSSEGGRATQLTTLYGINLWPEFSPEGTQIALLSSSRIYLMNPDGSDLTPILDEGASGTMDWIP